MTVVGALARAVAGVERDGASPETPVGGVVTTAMGAANRLGGGAVSATVDNEDDEDEEDDDEVPVSAWVSALRLAV